MYVLDNFSAKDSKKVIHQKIEISSTW